MSDRDVLRCARTYAQAEHTLTYLIAYTMQTHTHTHTNTHTNAHRVKDLDSDARWLRAAATENYDYNLGMRQINETMEGMRGVGGGGDEGEQEGDGYKWSQDGDDLEITLEVAEGVGKKDLKIVFGQVS
jgi:hypothetical protein